MSLGEIITKFLESIFKKSSSDSSKRPNLKKLETEIKSMTPVLIRGENLQPNFAEAIFTLYKNTRTLDDLFSTTIGAPDFQRKKRFEGQLIVTGFNPTEQDLLESLSYENRKAAIIAEAGNEREENRIYEHQRQDQEKLFKAMNSDSFRNMDKENLQLRQLVDLCKMNFLPVLQVFDGNFIPGDFSYQPTYNEAPIEKLLTMLEDYYYQAYGLRITNGMANAVTALVQLKHGENASSTLLEQYSTALKRIAFVNTKILTPENLKLLIRYGRGEEQYEPGVCSYTGSPRQDFASMMKEKFTSEEKRIRSELQDAQIEQELTTLFNGGSLLDVDFYDNRHNETLRADTILSFKYVLPMKILKTFLAVYVPDSIRTLLNDLVIEGFFVNASYKQNFSEAVYACLEADETIKNFEKSFGSDQPNSIAVLESYIKDSHKDKDFYKKLEVMVSKINDEAKNLIQTNTVNLYRLYKMLGELLADAKKPTGEIIENLKVTMLSSRNKRNTNFLEQSYGTWRVFFDIMKNYVILNLGASGNNGSV